MAHHAWTLPEWPQWEEPRRKVYVEESGEETWVETLGSAPPDAGCWTQGLLEG